MGRPSPKANLGKNVDVEGSVAEESWGEERTKKLTVLNDADRAQVRLTKTGYFSMVLAGLEWYLDLDRGLGRHLGLDHRLDRVLGLDLRRKSRLDRQWGGPFSCFFQTQYHCLQQ